MAKENYSRRTSFQIHECTKNRLDEFDQPVLTPNALLRAMAVQFLEEDLDQLDDIAIMTKRAKYLKTCME